MRAVRSVAGILAGIVVFAAVIRLLTVFGGLPDAAPGNYLLATVCWAIAGGILSGFVTAWIAGAHEFPHVAAVGMFMVWLGFMSMRAEGVTQPGWEQITIAGCGPISAMIGAAIRVFMKLRRGVRSTRQ